MGSETDVQQAVEIVPDTQIAYKIARKLISYVFFVSSLTERLLM